MKIGPSTFRKRYTLFPFLVVCLVGYIVLLEMKKRDANGSLPASGKMLSQGEVAGTGQAKIGGNFSLRQADGTPEGTPVSADTLKNGKYHLLFFGFTNCPDVCPAMLQMMADTMQKLPEQTQEKLQMVFISVDPERDNFPTLKTYVESFDERFVGWSGTAEELDAMSKNYLFYFAKRPPANADDPLDYQVDHSAYLYLFGPDGAYITHFTNTIPQGDLLGKLTGLVG